MPPPLEKFKYADFWKTWQMLGTPVTTSDMVVHEYRANYPVIKYQSSSSSEGPERPFLHKGMLARRLASDDPLVLEHPEKYRYGAYVVFSKVQNMDNQDAAWNAIRRKKELYIVDICKKNGVADLTSSESDPPTTMYTADHFSFIVSPNDPPHTKLRFHRTEYVPFTATTGRCLRVQSHLPLEFPMDSLVAKLSHEMRVKYDPLWVKGIFARGLVPMADSATAATPSSSDGGAARRRSLNRPMRIKTFDQLWYRLPIAHMLVFAVPTVRDDEDGDTDFLATETYDVTVYVRSRSMEAQRGIRMQHARWFRIASNQVNNQVNNQGQLERSIAKAFSGIQWSDLT